LHCKTILLDPAVDDAALQGYFQNALQLTMTIFRQSAAGQML
jgi:hypothetical protein